MEKKIEDEAAKFADWIFLINPDSFVISPAQAEGVREEAIKYFKRIHNATIDKIEKEAINIKIHIEAFDYTGDIIPLADFRMLMNQLKERSD